MVIVDDSNIHLFRAALQQFGYAGYQLLDATFKLPRSGDWKWKIATGLPLLLISSGIGTLIFKIMTRCLYAAGIGVVEGSRMVYRRFFETKNVRHIPPPRNAKSLHRSTQPQSPTNESKNLLNVVEASQPPVKKALLDVNAAKERNNALMQMLDLIDKFVIQHLGPQKDLLKNLGYEQEQFNAWIKSMVLWRLCLTWDYFEDQYLQMKAPAVLSKEQIIVAAKQIDPSIGELIEKGDQEESKNPLNVIYDSTTLTQQRKLELLALVIKLQWLSGGQLSDTSLRSEEEKESLKRFAMLMNHGMANTLTHMTSIIQGYVVALAPPQVEMLPVLPPAKSDNKSEAAMSPLAPTVKGVFEALQKELTSNYLQPLWVKKFQEWNQDASSDLSEFIGGKQDEKTFLKQEASETLSTSAMADTFFLRAATSMHGDGQKIKAAINSVLKSFFDQIENTTMDLLLKSTDALDTIPFESIVPKLTDYLIKVLECCKVMRNDTISDQTGHALQQVPEELANALTQNQVFENQQLFNELYLKTSSQVSGEEMVGRFNRFNEEFIHNAARRGLDSSTHEQGWIKEKLVALQTIFKLSAEKYAQMEGSLLSRIFAASQTNQPSTLVGLLINVVQKLRKIPALESVMAFLFSGIEATLVHKSVEAVQSSLNDLTTTSAISTFVGVTVVKGLISKEKWHDNLPMLQQAYRFLRPEERKGIDKSLESLFSTEWGARQHDLTELKNSQLDTQIDEMIKLEDKYQELIESISKKILDLSKNPEKNEDVTVLTDACQKLKRQKELEQFARIRTLVLFVAEKELAKVEKLPSVAKEIALRGVHDAMNLLTSQEIIKHWIFTITDLLLDELQEVRTSREISSKRVIKNYTLLGLILPEKKDALAKAITSMMSAANQDQGYLSIAAWGAWFSNKVVQWSPTVVTQHIDTLIQESSFNTFNSSDPKEKFLKSLEGFGRDPHGLSEVVIQLLRQHVADPQAALSSGKQEINLIQN